MDGRTRASLLWGAVAALAFLVLVQGYNAVAGPGVGFLPLLGVAVVVFAAAAAAAYALDRWLAARAGG